MPANPNPTVTTPYLATLFKDTSSDWSKTYSAVGAGIVRITPLKMKRGKSKTSNLASASRAHTYKPGWVDNGEAKVLIRFAAADFSAMFTYFMTDTDPRYFKVRYNDGTAPTTGSTQEFLGFVMEIGDEQFDDETEDTITTELTICASGAVVFTSAT